MPEATAIVFLTPLIGCASERPPPLARTFVRQSIATCPTPPIVPSAVRTSRSSFSRVELIGLRRSIVSRTSRPVTTTSGTRRRSTRPRPVAGSVTAPSAASTCSRVRGDVPLLDDVLEDMTLVLYLSSDRGDPFDRRHSVIAVSGTGDRPRATRQHEARSVRGHYRCRLQG
ncbi:MAG: hypothetical protein AVDCRST_MAG87-2124 [uncultured Thermomicrobiales bacterium]|uniref:Uncharacterized protein n=1 Tax=uncultured Thermomicrobiales bacterium TaxID=1645740 RepID=A0A6J4V806_9BACT|nr:MAG: hypothetical protein AVDCRST_MAG87-2124 [uncultured Thermomicrobiales bacterium]